MDPILLLNHLKENWSVISQAPWLVLPFGAVMITLGYLAARWWYSGRIESANSRIESAKASNEILTEHLKLKTAEAELNREHASKWREKIDAVASSGSAELREKTLNVVDRLRRFSDRHRQQEDDVIFGEGEIDHRRFGARSHEYEREFKVDVMLLRDELLHRLPEYQPIEKVEMFYERPTNDIGLRRVVNDLERMAKMLK